MENKINKMEEKMNQRLIVEPTNKEWGFWGTIPLTNFKESAYPILWNHAINELNRVLGRRYNPTNKEAGLILDSRIGRHLCDKIAHLDSILEAMNELSLVIERWKESFGETLYQIRKENL